MSAEMLYDKFIRVFSRGETIFKNGSIGKEMYIVSSGKVKLYSDSDSGRRTVLAVLKPGEHFGEMALVDGSPRSATAVALQKNTRLIVLDKAKFMYLVQQQPEFAFVLMETLCQRIRDANEQLAQFKSVKKQGSKNKTGN